MKSFVLKLVDHKNKKVFYRVEQYPEGRDSLATYIKFAKDQKASGKIETMLPHHKAVANHLAQYGADTEQQIVHVLAGYADLKSARKATKDLRRQMARIDESLGYEKLGSRKQSA